MKLITIGFRESLQSLEPLQQTFQDLCSEVAQAGFDLSVEPYSKGGYVFLSCHVHNSDLSFRSYEQVKDLLKQKLAVSLAQYMKQVSLPDLCRRIASKIRSEVSVDEWKQLVQDLEVRLLAEPMGASLEVRIIDYFEHSFDMSIDGFVNFRLKDYRQRGFEFLDQLLDDLKIEQEYEEFIEVLRYFVLTQEPRLDQVHVLLQDLGRFEILDEQGLPVPALPVNESDEQDMTIHDLLVSQLIGLAPGTIVLHVHQRGVFQEWVHTLRQVFGDRILICQGCEACYNAAYVPTFERTKFFQTDS